jgi:hypothetical protein
MLLAEEKARWLLELAENPLFRRGDSYHDLVFYFNGWELILTEDGGHLIYIPLSRGWSVYNDSFRVLSVLEKLPGTKKEFYFMLEEIKEDGKLIPIPNNDVHYCLFKKNKKFNYDLVGILKSFDFKTALNERERFKFAVKKELDEALTPRFRFSVIYFFSTVLLLIVAFIIYLLDLLKLFEGIIEKLSKIFTIQNTIIFYLFYLVCFYLTCLIISMFYKKIKIHFILKAIDQLGSNFFNLSTTERKDFLLKEQKINRDIIFNINYTETALSNSKINFIN